MILFYKIKIQFLFKTFLQYRQPKSWFSTLLTTSFSISFAALTGNVFFCTPFPLLKSHFFVPFIPKITLNQWR